MGWVLGCCLLLAACAGPREGTREAPPLPPPPEPPAAGPVTRTLQGFRIQLVTTPEKDAADAYVEQAIDWWAALPAGRRPDYLATGNELDVKIAWRQPYYRVRVGSFASRAEAEAALEAVRARFPDAFIVPDTVTVTR